MTTIKPGKVYITGAGPGDPGLLTLNAKKALEAADVLIYDHLVSEDCMKFCKESIKKIYVGKTAGKHTYPQEEINRMIAEEALAGNTVVRLKGGDPFIFGRGSEECLYLRECNIPFEVVPGISALSAVPAYAGIPLTHRNLSTHFCVVTGHEEFGKDSFSVNWKTVAELGGTLVIYMGITNIRGIADELMKHGRESDTPVSVIRWGTTPQQELVVGTLSTIADQIEAVQLRPPGLIIIGEVVDYHNQINWFQCVLNQRVNKEKF